MCDKKNEKSNSSFSPFYFFFGLLGVVGILFTYFFVSKNKDSVFSLESGLKKEGKEKKVVRNVRKEKNENLNDRQKKILDVLKKDKEVTVDLLLKKISGVSERTFRRDMNKFESLGYIKKTGSTKSAKYILKK